MSIPDYDGEVYHRKTANAEIANLQTTVLEGVISEAGLQGHISADMRGTLAKAIQ